MVCIILCDDAIIDANFYPKLQWAIDELTKQNDFIEFWFADGNVLCLDAVLEAKTANPDSDIKLVSVGNPPHSLPECVWDRSIECPANIRNAYRWMMDQCHYIIYYHYNELNAPPDNLPYRYALQASAKIINISQGIDPIMKRCEVVWLNDNERQLKSLLAEKKKYSTIAREMGLSSQAIVLRTHQLVRKLRKCARYEKMMTEIESRDDPLSRPIICSLLDFNAKANPKRIQQAVDFVYHHYRDCTFLVDESMRNSKLVAAVRNIKSYSYWDAPSQSEPRICLVAHAECGETVGTLKKNYGWRFYGILHIDTEAVEGPARNERLWSMMLAQSDFVICSGTDSEKRIAALQAASGCPPEIIPRLKVLNVSHTGE